MIVRELINLIGFKVSESQWRSAEGKVTALQRRMQSIGMRMSLMFTLPFALLSKQLIGTLSHFEQLNIAFETMVGNADEANQLVQEMLEFAAKTPFEIKEIGPTVKMLLAMGSSTEIVLDELKMLGDVAAGLSVPISRLALNFGQVRAQARLTGREVRDFAVAGVPLLSELAKMLNTTEAAVKEMVSKGAIGFDQVKEAFKRMTTEGGRFANLMIKQSKTLGGMWSNFMDIITLSVMSLEKTLLPILKDILLTIISIFDFFNTRMSPTLKTVIFFMFAFLAIIGPLLLAFSGLITLGKFVAGAFAAIGAMATKASIPVALLIGKFLLIAIAVAAFAILLAGFIEDLIIFSKGGESFIGRFLPPWEELAPRIKAALDPFLQHVRNLWAFIKNIFWSITSFIYKFISDDVEGAVEDLEEIIKNAFRFFGALLVISWKLFKGFLVLFGGLIVEVLWPTIKRGLAIFGSFLIQNITMLYNKVKGIVVGWIESLKNLVFGFFEGILDKILIIGEKLGLFKPARFGVPGPVGTSPLAPALALAGAGGGRKEFVTRSVNVRSTIHTQVPMGTPEEQIEAIDKQARMSAEEVFNKEIRNLISQNLEVE